ncbi:protein-L-isoaspartate(D-aspartate) O-methyltransferase [Actinophytocola sp.]|uniref:protein-L-isoaspartate(D-aspartate) O-methyltransferase n=1 Tax=Actinophytocola sp. TaxID=1872138 RepID=UPI003D6AE152
MKLSHTALVREVEAAGIGDPRVLDAFRRTRRDLFVSADRADLAYHDTPIPIGHDQVTTQPTLVAVMIAALRLRGAERVLEIGTGLGFQTALLARLAHWVYSVEHHADLARRARDNLATAGIDNATVVVRDGTTGLPDHAPYQGIVVSAAAPRVPRPLADQLDEGGRLVQPIGVGGAERVMAFHKDGGDLVEQEELITARFVPLIGEHGLP